MNAWMNERKKERERETERERIPCSSNLQFSVEYMFIIAHVRDNNFNLAKGEDKKERHFCLKVCSYLELHLYN